MWPQRPLQTPRIHGLLGICAYLIVLCLEDICLGRFVTFYAPLYPYRNIRALQETQHGQLSLPYSLPTLSLSCSSCSRYAMTHRLRLSPLKPSQQVQFKQSRSALARLRRANDAAYVGSRVCMLKSSTVYALHDARTPSVALLHLNKYVGYPSRWLSTELICRVASRHIHVIERHVVVTSTSSTSRVSTSASTLRRTELNVLFEHHWHYGRDAGIDYKR
jgi:hypothetical protein